MPTSAPSPSVPLAPWASIYSFEKGKAGGEVWKYPRKVCEESLNRKVLLIRRLTTTPVPRILTQQLLFHWTRWS